MPDEPVRPHIHVIACYRDVHELVPGSHRPVLTRIELICGKQNDSLADWRDYTLELERRAAALVTKMREHPELDPWPEMADLDTLLDQRPKEGK